MVRRTVQTREVRQEHYICQFPCDTWDLLLNRYHLCPLFQDNRHLQGLEFQFNRTPCTVGIFCQLRKIPVTDQILRHKTAFQPDLIFLTLICLQAGYRHLYVSLRVVSIGLLQLRIL